MNKPLLTLLAPLLFFAITISHVNAQTHNGFEDVERVRNILEKPDSVIDYALAKLTVDKIIDPSIDIQANLERLDNMAQDVKVLAGPSPSAMALKDALRRYLYTKGPWNHNQPFLYDFSDPLGTQISNKLLPNYLALKRGNCISMPFLFLILGDKLGLDVAASTAPLHVFVKFTDSATGMTYNLETTAGANPTRDSSYRRQAYMTDQAIANGVYLQPLSRKETVAVMATVLLEHYLQQQEYDKTIIIGNVILKHYPKYPFAMLKKANAYAGLMKRHGLWQYRSSNEVPVAQRKQFNFLVSNTNTLWQQAYALGWREQPKQYDARYVNKMDQKNQ